MRETIDRTEVNEIVRDLKKILKVSVKEGKNLSDVVYSREVIDIIDDAPIGTGDGDSTIYSYGLGKYWGRVTKANLNKDEVDGFGCKRIDVNNAMLEIIVQHNEDDDNICEGIELSLVVNVDWLDRYDNWHFYEYITMKTWKVL